MLSYLIVLLSSIVIYWIGLRCTINGQKVKTSNVALVAALPIILNAGLRYNVGNDYGGYLYVFNEYKTKGTFVQDGAEWGEPLFRFLNKFLIFWEANPQWIFVIFGLVFSIFVYLQIEKDSPYPLLSIYLLFMTKYYFAYLNVSRQLCACAILFFSIRYIESKNIKKFMICFIFAFGLHMTSFVFLPMYYLGRKKFNVKSAIFLTAAIIITKPLLEYIMFLLFKSTKYSMYIGTAYQFEGAHYFNLLIQLVIFVMALLFREKQEVENKSKYDLYLYFQLFAIWIMIFSGSLPLIDRIRFYFTLPTIILLPLAIKNVHNKWIKIICTIGMMACFFVYTYYGICMKGEYTVIPYNTIFTS